MVALPTRAHKAAVSREQRDDTCADRVTCARMRTVYMCVGSMVLGFAAHGLYVRGLNGFGGLLLTSVLDFVAVGARICSTPKVEGPSTNSTEWPFGAFSASHVGNVPFTISRATRINEFADGG